MYQITYNGIKISKPMERQEIIRQLNKLNYVVLGLQMERVKQTA